MRSLIDQDRMFHYMPKWLQQQDGREFKGMWDGAIIHGNGPQLLQGPLLVAICFFLAVRADSVEVWRLHMAGWSHVSFRAQTLLALLHVARSHPLRVVKPETLSKNFLVRYPVTAAACGRHSPWAP